ncbi:hypothetical protein Y032_0354g3305 [Ancylostoma ceylanicum]|nr:hypothetical protein Y032_0354g3305 [Ancylostoma ceylanicum]
MKSVLLFPIEDDRRSAVIPRLRDKPPRTPSAGRRASSRHSANKYDPAASVERHQSAGSRASRASQRSEQGNERQNSSNGSRRRSTSRSSRTTSAQKSQPKLPDNQHLQETYSVAGNAGNVAMDAQGRPTSFTIIGGALHASCWTTRAISRLDCVPPSSTASSLTPSHHTTQNYRDKVSGRHASLHVHPLPCEPAPRQWPEIT